MKKPIPILIAPRCHVREVLSPDDADRLLASGSWVRVATTKPPARSTRTVAAFRQRKKEKGYRQFHVMLSGEVIDGLHAQKRDGETLADVVGRLLRYGDGN